ncbi:MULTISPECIES: hypothetical protein [unclassified Corallococcus]|uniref:hypothetical protein n=1 Tax=unclassified Corallococcus TaxID=2685029 RepID=UPI001A8C4DB4|nr:MULTISPECIES: hypothetical protein [unclassified Corallococcus]MBN9688473.1 hypothetical protein [Corallococcus sp. NCSPR001]WAS87726.1 hypothetical protein O0N60_12285 [Corallococcus sp. NCRR]
MRFDSARMPARLDGPMPGTPLFNTAWDALLAACPLILSQRNATAGNAGAANFDVRWRMSKEYCAWLYYVPDDRYALSKLVESSDATRSQFEQGCRAPAFVQDPRYPPDSLKYLYFLHNHPATPTNLSERDLAALAKMARIHGGYVETKAGRLPIGIVAFFSEGSSGNPTGCDGFYEYTYGSAEVVRWTPDDEGRWRRTRAGTVTWDSETEFRFVPTR